MKTLLGIWLGWYAMAFIALLILAGYMEVRSWFRFKRGDGELPDDWQPPEGK